MDQIQANFKVYKSSAGSGKTFTLVKEFLKLCLKNSDTFTFSRILAITFTNKATFEMKGRILKALKELSANNPNTQTLKNVLLEETKLTEADLQERSNRILKAILHNYADFSISTIDRFTHRVIRTFSKDLRLSPVFKVELDEKTLLSEVVDLLIDSVGRDQELTDLILRFTFFRMEEERAWKVDKDLLEFAQRILQEKALPHLIALRKLKTKDFDESIKLYKALTSKFENELERIGVGAVMLIRDKGIQKASLANGGAILTYFNYLKSVNVDKLEPTKTLKANIEKDNWYSGKCPENDKSAIDSIKSKLEKLYNQAQELIESDYAKYLAASEIIKPIHSLSLLNQIEKKLAEYKKEEKVLNISDFNRIISNVVMREPIPFIYERLGNRYQHLMIDEFQDTSELQFSNLLPLIEDSLSKGKENLIVGDAKQAIYRFRGGEVEQFSEMPYYKPSFEDEEGVYEERMRTLQSQYAENNLEQNFRSTANVVNFNNEFFEFIKNSEGISPKIASIYKGHNQKIVNTEEGYVEISFSAVKTKIEKQESFESKTLATIEQCLTDSYALKDIAILFRKKEHAENMADFLKSAGIDIISSEALKLKNDSEVRFIINLAKWIYTPESHLIQKEIVEFLFRRENLTEDLDHNFLKYIGDGTTLNNLFEEHGFKLDVDQLKVKSSHEFFEKLIRVFQLDENYNLYLQALQDTVLDYSKRQKDTIPQFIEWWAENEDKLSLDIPEDLDAVSLMTIHKSKGLEFPVVIYPYANQEIEFSGPMRKDYLWTKTLDEPKAPIPFALVEFNKKLEKSELSKVFCKELEKKQIDLVNVAYVAFTRAVDRLYIHTEDKSIKPGSNLNLPQLLKEFTLQSNYNEHNGIFSIGQLKTKSTELEIIKQAPTFELDYISESWNDKLKISISSPINKQNEKLQYGIIVHEVLGEIHDKCEVDQIIERYELEGKLTREQSLKLKLKLNELLSKKEVEIYFSKAQKCKREASLIDQTGNILRPDRVVYFKDKIVVLDYKTGERNEAHQKQLNEYTRAIEQYEEMKVEAYILYLESEELVAV